MAVRDSLSATLKSREKAVREEHWLLRTDKSTSKLTGILPVVFRCEVVDPNSGRLEQLPGSCMSHFDGDRNESGPLMYASFDPRHERELLATVVHEAVNRRQVIGTSGDIR